MNQISGHIISWQNETTISIKNNGQTRNKKCLQRKPILICTIRCIFACRKLKPKEWIEENLYPLLFSFLILAQKLLRTQYIIVNNWNTVVKSRWKETFWKDGCWNENCWKLHSQINLSSLWKENLNMVPSTMPWATERIVRWPRWTNRRTTAKIKLYVFVILLLSFMVVSLIEREKGSFIRTRKKRANEL